MLRKILLSLLLRVSAFFGLIFALAACSDSDDRYSYASDGILYVSGAVNGRPYVDLGLPSGTLWAAYNLGAHAPEQYGEYYAWGETAPKPASAYYWDNYLHQIDGEFIKYDDIDFVTELDVEDDAASINWGGYWRMPAHEQQTELRTECFWQWTDSYNGTGVSGCIVFRAKDDADKGFTGDNANKYKDPVASYSLSDPHIFLPAAGYRCDDMFMHNTTYGGYWTSSLYTDDFYYAWGMFMGPGSVGGFGQDPRYYGQSVRPVHPPLH